MPFQPLQNQPAHPDDHLRSFEGAENIVVTITGSLLVANSAQLAKSLLEENPMPANIHVIDSLSAGGG